MFTIAALFIIIKTWKQPVSPGVHPENGILFSTKRKCAIKPQGGNSNAYY